jgi:hypothetical protein
MAGVTAPYHLQSIERYIASVHGGARELTLSERNVLYAYAQAMTDQIEQIWPVDTSLSRDNWTFTISGRADWVGFTIENLLDYAEYVHRKGQTTPLIESEVPSIIDAGLARLLPALRSEIDSTEKRIADSKRRGGRGLPDVLQQKPATPLATLIDMVLNAGF